MHEPWSMSPMCTYTQIINKGEQKEKEEYNKVINLNDYNWLSFGNAHKDISIPFFTNLCMESLVWFGLSHYAYVISGCHALTIWFFSASLIQIF